MIVTNVGFITGITTLVHSLNRLQPSIIAASSNSPGISLKNPVNSKVLNEMFTATYGRISPKRVPRIPINESIRYTGNSST